MFALAGKGFDVIKSWAKAAAGAYFDIAKDHLVPKTLLDNTEENLISDESATDFAGHTLVINTLAISDDGETLFSAGKDKQIRMWHTRTGQSAGIVGQQEFEVKIYLNAMKQMGHHCFWAGQRDYFGP
jgi:WD40 repeat protein